MDSLAATWEFSELAKILLKPALYYPLDQRTHRLPCGKNQSIGKEKEIRRIQGPIRWICIDQVQGRGRQ